MNQEFIRYEFNAAKKHPTYHLLGVKVATFIARDAFGQPPYDNILMEGVGLDEAAFSTVEQWYSKNVAPNKNLRVSKTVPAVLVRLIIQDICQTLDIALSAFAMFNDHEMTDDESDDTLGF